MHIRNHAVYEKVPIEQCIQATCKRPVRVRWLDINKWDDITREYRSRLVAQEIQTDKREDLFAATPPLEAKKMLFSVAVTAGVGHQEGNPSRGTCMDFIDIRRAFFHAEALREVYICLPP